jgi:hypothetical protein
MNPLRRLTEEILKKLENHTATEATILRQSSHGRLRLIGIVIGIIVVILAGFWMTHHQ